MKRLTPIVILALVFAAGSCKKPSQSGEIALSLAKVGDKTDLYTVVAKNQLELAPGVTMTPADGPCGPGSGMVLMRDNEIGGYVACGCVGATRSSCKTTNDNPNHPACEGGCVDDQGVDRGCQISEPLPGPPRDPLMIKFRAR